MPRRQFPRKISEYSFFKRVRHAVFFQHLPDFPPGRGICSSKAGNPERSPQIRKVLGRKNIRVFRTRQMFHHPFGRYFRPAERQIFQFCL